MASSYEAFRDLELNRDEVERITDALKNKEFRKLLTDYVEEVRDPENQKLYQKEITQLEKERGIDVTFINPEAGYVIKTSANGSKKCFINICSNDIVRKPLSNPAVQEGSKGCRWSLPHSLTPPREDIDNKGDRCVVYDVVFHTDTLHLARKNKAFREMVNGVACSAIESNFNVALDTKNLKFPKMQYKGFPQAAVIRKPSNETLPQLSPEEQEVMDKLFAQLDQSKSDQPTKPKVPVKKNDDKSLYTTPLYVVKHRRSYEMEEFMEHKTAKINTALPKELVVEISLPLLKSSSDIVLDVAEKTLQLVSEKPAKYKLSLTLPYYVNQDNGNAKFDKDKKKLVITLPVKNNRTYVINEKDDSGVDTDHGSLASSPLEELNDSNMETNSLNTNLEKITNEIERFTFLDTNYHYSLPEFTSYINEHENVVVFTINVKNVDEMSVKKIINETNFHIKFISISTGFFPLYYALYAKFPHFLIETNNVAVETWDNNLTVQIHYVQNTQTIGPFLFGLDENNLSEKHFETHLTETSATPETVPESFPLPIKKSRPKKSKKRSAIVEQSDETERSIPIDIIGASESSGDEFCRSLSPAKGRGILKTMRNARRTVSESCLDDVAWGSLIETSFTSVDSVIPEEGEVSGSLKKTVRFNNVVSRKLYRSNSSILGQRKKNQRKAKAKKRAQERRHSESEISETDESKERDAETTSGNESEKDNEKSTSEDSNFGTDIFELDIN